MSLAGNVKELYALVTVDRALLVNEVIHLCVLYRDEYTSSARERIEEIKRRAQNIMGQSNQPGFEIPSDSAKALLGDLLGIAQ